ncbi:Fe(3+)-hydroxamate ABC transporter permease FhuB [Pistricoccus aurantiacus]|uniref:Fe(3+)-hydroxamate ABC transporter permease FhuB n=1 Tax=Pistricoccus aurantiacus TaxID=1883414 RepID=A0A5B8SPT5_9GAMM|nr:Fe(3+)-hydroxamate ABC transporter permease FhuB [Pistricoccus aurantiacus]QEA39132.1 Fe(3+)-hydroxamate ABC transporter permease FhuB [Pistricoccus aurantiacus]
MPDATLPYYRRRGLLTRLGPAGICLLLTLILAALIAWVFATEGLVVSLAALFSPGDTLNQTVLHYSWWPRLVMALLAGAGLSLAGVLMQQVLRNPLASPTTLGVTQGASLALMTATLTAPGLMIWGREWVALGGGIGAMGLVFALTWKRDFAPVVVVLAGLVINLYAAALGVVLLLFYQEELKGILIWGAGSLSQNDWSGAGFLLPRLLVGTGLALLLSRALRVLELDDASASSLGASLGWLRVGGLGVAIFLTACVVSAVGVVGFIGLAAPAIVRLAGARRLTQRLLWGSLLGALMLAITDQAVQQFTQGFPMLIPTGATAALLGAPLLLWLLPRLKLTSDRPASRGASLGKRHPAPLRLGLVLLGSIVLASLLALLLGHGGQGWQWLSPGQWDIIQWRLPRLLAAAGSGILLAIAGTLIQRLSANPMASPEVLGISGGAAIALMITIFLNRSPSQWTLLGMGTLGAAITLLALILLNRRSGFLPERLLLTGVAITALFDAVRAILLAGGDPRGIQVLAWLSGSTYYVDLPTATVIILLALLLGATSLPFARWLDILPLGAATSRALGIHLTLARLALLGLVALLTACATLVVGPLSFIGLLAPHLARLLGFARARQHLVGAMLVGALLMISADWVGRQLLFPQEVPAGLMASLLGGAYFLWSLRRL